MEKGIAHRKTPTHARAAIGSRNGRSAGVFVLVSGLAAGACDGGKTEYMGEQAPFAGCEQTPTAPPAALGLDPFYAKYLDGYGSPVLSSASVQDEALVRACRITGEMLSARADLRKALAANHLRVAVLATSEHTTEIPEYSDLNSAFPNTSWDQIRGIGATRARPVASAGEENLLCSDGDPNKTQSILIWLLAYAIRELGIADLDSQFDGRLQAAYRSAMNAGLWANTLAATDAPTYFAEGAQAYFGGDTASPVNSRDALMAYDAGLAALLAEWLPAISWHASCY